MNEICSKRCMQLLHFPMISILQIFQVHLVCKSAVNWLPEWPAAGAPVAHERAARQSSRRLSSALGRGLKGARPSKTHRGQRVHSLFQKSVENVIPFNRTHTRCRPRGSREAAVIGHLTREFAFFTRASGAPNADYPPDAA